MTQETKAKVKAAADALEAALRKSVLREPLTIEVGEPSDTDTGGSRIIVATLGPKRPFLEVWFDKWLDGERMVYWAGFGAEKRNLVEEIVSDCPRVEPLSRTLGENDFEKRGEIFCLKKEKQPTDAELQFPIQEFEGEYNGFGVYGRPSEPFDAGKATMFIESVIRSLPEYDLSDDYSAFENRKVVGWHIRAERDPNLARECKVRDQYKCRVCDFHFVEKYGSLGKDFAEAHHIVWLARLEDEVQNSLDDLVTVCANCHRMLHRMEGKPEDIDKLRGMLKH